MPIPAPTLAELHAAALNACAERDTIARTLAASDTGEPVDLGALTAARASAKAKIDLYLEALAEAQRKAPRKARPPVSVKPSPRKGRKVKPLDT
jgi:hypothetical protein